MSTARVVGLIARCGNVLGVSPAARAVLIAVVERVYDAGRWTTGDLHVAISTRRLALELDLSERQVQRHLADFERLGWLIRRYAWSNRRIVREGLDLRPLAARLDELIAGAADVDRMIAQGRAQAAAERDDASIVAETIDRATEMSGVGDISVTPESTILIPPSIDGVQARQDAPPGNSGTGDRALIELMVVGSLTLQHSLGAADIDDPDPARIARAVTWIADRHGIRRRLDPALWSDAIRRHGLAALAAVLIAIDRPGVRDPAAYLAGMLRRPRLRETVIHSLRLIDRPTPSSEGYS